MRLLTLILLFFFSLNLFSQPTTDIFRIDSLPTEGVLLDKGWKFHAGDNPDWAKPDFDDSAWEGIDPTKTIHYLPQIRKEPVGWFRLKLNVDSSLLNKPLAFQIYQSIASEIYIDGHLIKQFGVVSPNEKDIKAFQSLYSPVGFQLEKKEAIIAVRFSVQPNLYYPKFHVQFMTFQMRINYVWGAGQYDRISNNFPILNGLYAGAFIILSIIHFAYFLFNKKQKANLYFTLATVSVAIAHIITIYFVLSNSVSFRSYSGSISYFFLFTMYNTSIYIAVYHLFKRPHNALFYVLVIYSFLSFFIWFYLYERVHIWAFVIPFIVLMLDALRIAYNAYRNNFKDSGIIIIGLTGYLIFYLCFHAMYEGFINNQNIGFGSFFTLGDLFYQISTVIMPIALSLYLSSDFAYTSKSLEQKLEENLKLSEEKQHILATQNETLEKQVKERTAELIASQNQLIQKEKLASLGELTAGIAHEIQNPLNFVNNFSELSVDLVKDLKDELKKPEKDEAYIDELFDDLSQNQEKINHHGKRASSIVRGMLEHSRTSTGIKEPTDINKLVDESLRLSYHAMRAKDKSFNADFTTDFDENLPKIEVIPQDMGRVLLNLINNAFYAVNQRAHNFDKVYNPSVVVSTQQTDNQIIIKVKDNGIGMSEATKAKVFQPFFTTKPTGEGTGLGLSLSYDIVVKGHGGTLEVESNEGLGSAFILALPINA